jgi:hypothetical protein
MRWVSKTVTSKTVASLAVQAVWYSAHTLAEDLGMSMDTVITISNIAALNTVVDLIEDSSPEIRALTVLVCPALVNVLFVVDRPWPGLCVVEYSNTT